MAKSKLKDALAREQGVDQYKEHQKKVRKDAEKRKRQRKESESESDDDDGAAGVSEDVNMVDASTETSESGSKVNDKAVKSALTKALVNGNDKNTKQVNGKKLVDSDDEDEDDDDWESEEEEEDSDEDDTETPKLLDTSRLDDSDTTDSDEEDEEEEKEGVVHMDGDELGEDDEEDEDIPLSDISEDDQEPDTDLIPRQKLTIDNHPALLAAHSSIALPIKKLPFSEHMSVTSSEPISIPDVDDDLKRELAFYAQALDAANRGRKLLTQEGLPFSRPSDFFAEMVKSEEHMGKIKDKLREEAAGKKASQEAKRQRDLKKFGKQVQVAKLQERQKEKRATLDKISMLKRKRSGADLGATEDDPFDIAVEKATSTDNPKKRARRDGTGPNPKRQSKDAKYGFGGKKRHAKSGDAKSSSDMSGFSSKAMKSSSFGRTGKRPSAKGGQRPGKSKRQGKR